MRDNKSFFALLGILSTGPHSGYDIKQKIEQSLSHFWSESYGQIYPNLKKMTEAGYVTSEAEAQTGKPDRILYSMTEKGLQVLREWLLKPIDHLPPEKNEILLKLYFGKQVSVKDNIQLIENYRQKVQEVLNIFDAIAPLLLHKPRQGQEPDYMLLTLKYGQKAAVAIMEWCNESIEDLQSHSMEKE